MNSTANTEIVRWSEIDRETEKAIKVSISRTGCFADVWIPKSIVGEVVYETPSSGTVELPVWFLVKNGF